MKTSCKIRRNLLDFGELKQNKIKYRKNSISYLIRVGRRENKLADETVRMG